jgi:hypothetical protein
LGAGDPEYLERASNGEVLNLSLQTFRIVKHERESGMSIHKVNQKLFAVVDNVGKFVIVIGTYEQCKCYIAEVEGS